MTETTYNLCKQILLIMIGGGLGSLSRFGLSVWVQSQTENSFFPFGILLVNLVGCFAAGLIVGLLFEHYQLGMLWRSALIFGFLGGFTTFSSFSLDVLILIQSNEYIAALIYFILSTGGGLFATFLGLNLMRGIFLLI